jgi:hypothetical protein
MRMWCVNEDDGMLFGGVSLLTTVLLSVVNLSPNQVRDCVVRGFRTCALSLKFPCSAFLSGVRFLPIAVYCSTHGEDCFHLDLESSPILDKHLRILLRILVFESTNSDRVHNVQLDSQVTDKRRQSKAWSAQIPIQI